MDFCVIYPDSVDGGNDPGTVPICIWQGYCNNSKLEYGRLRACPARDRHAEDMQKQQRERETVKNNSKNIFNLFLFFFITLGALGALGGQAQAQTDVAEIDGTGYPSLQAALNGSGTDGQSAEKYWL